MSKMRGAVKVESRELGEYPQSSQTAKYFRTRYVENYDILIIAKL